MKTAKCCVKSVIGVKVINKRFLEFQTRIPNSRISMNFRFKNIWNSKLEFLENIKKKTPAPPRKKILGNSIIP